MWAEVLFSGGWGRDMGGGWWGCESWDRDMSAICWLARLEVLCDIEGADDSTVWISLTGWASVSVTIFVLCALLSRIQEALKCEVQFILTSCNILPFLAGLVGCGMYSKFTKWEIQTTYITNIILCLLFCCVSWHLLNPCVYIDLWGSEMQRIFFRVVLLLYLAVGRCLWYLWIQPDFTG